MTRSPPRRSTTACRPRGPETGARHRTSTTYHGGHVMPPQSKGQKETVGRVMHEYKHGEFKRGRDGKGGKVKNPKQAVAIALHEAGASNQESKAANRKSLAKTKSKERNGQTAQQEKEG